MRSHFVTVGAALAALLFFHLASAQEAASEADPAAVTAEQPHVPVAPRGPDDEFGRGVPRTAMAGFLDAVMRDDLERGAEYLDLRNLPRGMDASDGPELARQLAIVIDRAFWVDLGALSDDPKGHGSDALPAYRDFVERVDLPPSQVDVLLQRVPRGDGVSIWKVSNATVARIPDLYAHYGYGPVGEVLSELFPYVRVLGLALWEWVGLLLIFAVALGVASLVVRVAEVVLRRISSERAEWFCQQAAGPLRFLLLVVLFRQTVSLLAPSVGLRTYIQANTLLIAALAWLAVRVADVAISRAEGSYRSRRPALAGLLGRPASNAARIVIGAIAVIVWLNSMGIEVTALVAGLGIGGVALALAAQSTIEDIIAALTVVSTQTVRVGELCRVGTTLGKVEEIGLRTTRLRTFDDTLVTIPNAEFARQSVDNLGRRRKIRFHPRLRLRYDTTPEQIRYVLVEIRRLLYAHPLVLNDPARIRFVGIGESSLDLDVFAYVDTTVFGTYLEVAEDLNLRIVEIVRAAGTDFALPARATYVERGAGIDADRAREAEAQVGSWRAGGELFLPDFPPEEIGKLRGSHDWPPAGSPGAAANQGGAE